MRHDPRLRAAAQAIYDAVYPNDEWSPVGFDEAERCGTVHYRQAVDAAQRARGALASTGEQLPLALVARGYPRRHKGHFLADQA